MVNFDNIIYLMATKWDKKRSFWYCRAIEQSNYPQKAIAVLAPLLKKCEGVIDVGAGCGALSIPASSLVKNITAVEPSRWMYEVLLKRAKESGIKNIRACNTGWEGNRFRGNLHSKLMPHDMVICANLPESIVCSANFLKYISNISKKFIVYLQGAGEWDRFYYKKLYPMLFKKKYIYEGGFIKTYNFLYQHGIFANVRIFDFYLDQPFEDFDDAMDFWRHRLEKKLTAEKEKALARFLKKKLITSGQNNTLIAPFGLRKAAVMWWEHDNTQGNI